MAAGDDRWHLVTYDVRNPKRLRKCAKHLEGHGERVQYSVFRCRLTPAGAERLRWELTAMLEAEDRVLVIPLCDRCAAGVRATHSTAGGERLGGLPPAEDAAADGDASAGDWSAPPPTHRIV